LQAREHYPDNPKRNPWHGHRINNLFEVNSLRQLIDIDRVIACDNTSEFTEFGLHDSGRRDISAAALPQSDRPDLATLLEPGGLHQG
jgi:hypothetical protein